MSDLPLTLDQSDGDKLTLEFTKERFSEFIFTLLSTPRTETRRYKCGFDVDLNDIRLFIEKIQHKINTAHDVLNISFSAEVMLENSIQISYQSIDQLLSVDDPRSEKVKEISITLSPVIAFNRPEGKKSYEKQTINLSIRAGKIGEIETRITSTEISWPAGYFIILEEQYRLLNNSVRREKNRFIESIFFLKRIFLPYNRLIFLPLITSITSIAAALTGLFSIMYFEYNESRQKYYYNNNTGKLERLEVSHLEAAEQTELAAGIAIADSVRKSLLVNNVDSSIFYESGAEPKRSSTVMKEIITNKYSVGFGIFVAIYIYGNWYIANNIARERIGRLFLQKGSKPPRPELGAWEGVVGSLFLGVMASIFASSLLSLF